MDAKTYKTNLFSLAEQDGVKICYCNLPKYGQFLSLKDFRLVGFDPEEARVYVGGDPGLTFCDAKAMFRLEQDDHGVWACPDKKCIPLWPKDLDYDLYYLKVHLAIRCDAVPEGASVEFVCISCQHADETTVSEKYGLISERTTKLRQMLNS